MTVVSFVQTYLPFAQASEKYGVPALFALAQSAIETGWGKSTPGNMMFGIKANNNWNGKKQLLKTTEYHSDKSRSYPEIISIEKIGDNKYKYIVKDYFRAYNSPAESFSDHANFLIVNKRYSNAFNYSNNPELFAIEIAKAGYATASTYADLLTSTIQNIKNSGVIKTVLISGTAIAIIIGVSFAIVTNLKTK